MSPTRRTLLHRAGATLLVATAGCNARPAATRESTAPGTTRTTTTREPGAEPTARTTATPELDVDVSLDRQRHLLRGNRLEDWRPPPYEATPVRELPDEAREAVETAIETGRFTTDDPSRDLLSGLDGVDLVERRDEYYVLTNTFTEYVLNLDDGVDPESAAESATAHLDDEVVRTNPSVEDAVYTVLPSGTEVPSEEYRTLVFTDELRAFLDEYEYVRSDAGFGRLEFHVERHEPPHRLSAREATDEELWGFPVVEASEFSDGVRRAIRRTLDSDRRTPVYPDGSVGTLRPDRVPFRLEREFHGGGHVRIDGSVAVLTVDHVHWDRQPFEFAVRVVDGGVGPGDPAELEMAATNAGDLAAALTVPGLLPFGLLWARRVDGTGEPVQLWSPRYETAETVKIEDGVAKPDSYRRDHPVSPGETITRRYLFGRAGDGVRPGEYGIWGELWVRWATERGQRKYDWNSAIYPYELRIDASEP